MSKIVEFPEFNKLIKFNIWDTARQERFRLLINRFFRIA